MPAIIESAETRKWASCVQVIFISRIFIHTVRKGNFAMQDWAGAGATKWRAFFWIATIMLLFRIGLRSCQILCYFGEVRSIIPSCGKMPIVALIIEQSRVRFIFTRTFLGTAASRSIFKIFTPQASQVHCYSCYKTKSRVRTSISTVA